MPNWAQTSNRNLQDKEEDIMEHNGLKEKQVVNENEDLSVSVYPNPTTSTIYLKLDGSVNLDIRIVSSKGAVQNVHVKNEGDLFFVDVANLSSGMYALTATSDGKKFSTIFYKN